MIPMDRMRRDTFSKVKRVVIKVGSNVLTQDNGLNLGTIKSISGQISGLINLGVEVILVTSGAMASGLKKMGLPQRPEQIPQRQAAAAVGQAGLILAYEKAFSKHDKKVAQILLTSDDLSNRNRYLNARNTLNVLLSWKVVPIINENDTVKVEEIKFGDNDNLSAMIALLLDAHALINLTDIDGLYTHDPQVHENAKLLPLISTITKDIEDMAGGIPGALGTGGMRSKIKAARKLTLAGIPMVIANGKRKNVLADIFSGLETGTFFVPKKEKLASRKCWIGFSSKPRGTVVVDEGAKKAMVKRGKSLLPSGIVGVEGDFPVGSPVSVKAENGELLGIGLVNYSARDIKDIMGLKTAAICERLGAKSYDEVIHRNNLSLTGECGL
ncbi:MAG: glutamate 5-kinase [Proteobacteria bacterium]|nr:glutamate 5-kinase [Pseudomonadota bacterium]